MIMLPVYEGKWLIGLVTETNEQEQDVKVNFLHPSDPLKISDGQQELTFAEFVKWFVWLKLQLLPLGEHIAYITVTFKKLTKNLK